MGSFSETARSRGAEPRRQSQPRPCQQAVCQNNTGPEYTPCPAARVAVTAGGGAGQSSSGLRGAPRPGL